MRTIVEAHPGEDADHWRRYQPKTNLLWLHFVLFKLCETLYWPSEHSPKRKDRKQKKALVLESIMVQVEDLLSVERLVGEEESVFGSAAELVAVALEQGWLDQEDINA
jgi:serine/threonine-protein kinase haspin